MLRQPLRRRRRARAGARTRRARPVPETRGTGHRGSGVATRCVAIAEAIVGHARLRELHLDHNELGETGGFALLGSMRRTEETSPRQNQTKSVQSMVVGVQRVWLHGNPRPGRHRRARPRAHRGAPPRARGRTEARRRSRVRARARSPSPPRRRRRRRRFAPPTPSAWRLGYTGRARSTRRIRTGASTRPPCSRTASPRTPPRPTATGAPSTTPRRAARRWWRRWWRTRRRAAPIQGRPGATTRW